MPRRRYVSTDISTDRRVNQLAAEGGVFAALLYTWMVPHATDDGGITADLDELRLLVVPGIKTTPAAMQKAVDAMVSLCLIERADGRLFFPAKQFYKYQNYVNAKNRREVPENAAKPREVPENPASPPPSVTPSLSLSPSVGVEDARDEVSEIVSDFARIGTVNDKTVDYIEDDIEEYGIDWVQRAVKVAATAKASGDRPPWNYVEKTLMRWRKRGEPDDNEPAKQLQPAGRNARPHGNGVDLNDLDARLASL